tara:strand:+ start:106 stop:348 length:243 start_codon:yes stop_codon:yes gene_type:complete
MKILINEDFEIKRDSHPNTIHFNLKGYTINDVIEMETNNDFVVYFKEKTKDLELLDNEIWFSYEENNLEWHKMKLIIENA